LPKRWYDPPGASHGAADELAALLSELGIAVEDGLWTPADAGRLAESDFAGGFGRDVLRILIEPHDAAPETAVAVAADIEEALNRHGFTAPRLHHGYGAATWHVLRAAILLGRDIRVGLEDTTILADGRSASGNGELVEAAVSLVAALGRPA
jgi:uncharacterized protein (DUF849 family)